MRSGYYYMVNRCVYAGFSTQTHSPRRTSILYPLRDPPCVTYMLQLNKGCFTALGCFVPIAGT